MSRETISSQSGADIVPSGDECLAKIRLEPRQWALFLDIDGTLLDLAATPDEIIIPPDLPDILHQLSRKLGGALALVTGRALPYADQLFAPYRFPIAGLHGAERRDPSGAITRTEVDAEFATLKAALAREAASWTGVLIEDKGAAFAAHYRQAPEYQEVIETVMRRYLEMAGADFVIQHGKMVVEIRPAHASKGSALRAFLGEPPFQDRRPIAIGDDVTDEAMFRVVNELDGYSIRIGGLHAETAARSTLPSASAVRAILAALAHDGNDDIIRKENP